MLGTVTSKGHLPREGAKVQKSQERAKESDRLIKVGRVWPRQAPGQRKKAITKLPNQRDTVKWLPGHRSWVLSHGVGCTTLKEHTRGKEGRV